MGIVKTAKLIYDYIRYDENEKEETFRAIDGVDLEVEPGQFIAVLGHNGSGKSTLAKHLNALLVPSEGTVWLDNMDTRDDSHIWDIRQEAGMVFQNPDNQIVASVVEEDVGFGPENLGVETPEIWKRVAKSLEGVGMTAYRKHSPNKLSGGQKQRVAIAGVIAMQPEVIVLDEPTAMLDPKGRREVIDTVTNLCREKGITIVLITHHMSECIDADRLIVMSNGDVVADGTPQEVFSQVELMHSEGLAVPATTELMWQLNNKGFNLPLTALGIADCAEQIAKEIG